MNTCENISSIQWQIQFFNLVQHNVQARKLLSSKQNFIINFVSKKLLAFWKFFLFRVSLISFTPNFVKPFQDCKIYCIFFIEESITYFYFYFPILKGFGFLQRLLYTMSK